MASSSDDMDTDVVDRGRRPAAAAAGARGAGARATGAGGGGRGAAAAAAAAPPPQRGTLEGVLPAVGGGVAVGEGEYAKGTVKLVAVSNFMTYGVGVVIKPGPRLNLVLGPNGTGKSSLVCALCVCLGGSLKLLGRADNLRDFIRRGTDSCAVEVTLSGGPGSPDLRVRRTLEASTTTTGGETTEKVVSKFYMHDSLVKQADVLAAMQIMGVQLDNLCQFLPQDKVVEFARLDARQLLAATERAVGTGRLHEQHEQLTEKAAQLNELTVKRDSALRKAEKLRAQNAQLEREVKRFRQRRELLDRAELLKARAAWIKVDSHEEEAEDTQKALEAAIRRKQAASQALRDATAPAAGRKARASAAAEMVRKSNAARLKNLQALDASAQLADKRALEMADARKQLVGLEQAFARDRDELSALQAGAGARAGKIDEARRAVEAIEPAYEAAAEARDAARGAHMESGQDVHEAQARAREAARGLTEVSTALRECDSRRQLVLAKLSQQVSLRASLPDALTALDETMRKREGGVRGRGVWGPLAAEVEVRGAVGGGGAAEAARTAAAIVESCIARQRLSFVVTHREDRDNVLQATGAALPGAQVLLYAGPKAAAVSRPCGAAADYAGFGLVATVDDLIEAPLEVRQALASVCQSSSTFVAREGVTVEDVLNTIFPACEKVDRVVVLGGGGGGSGGGGGGAGGGGGTGGGAARAVLVTRTRSLFAAQGHSGASMRQIGPSVLLDAGATPDAALAASRRAELERRRAELGAAHDAAVARMQAAIAWHDRASADLRSTHDAFERVRDRRQRARTTLNLKQKQAAVAEEKVRQLTARLADPAAARRGLEDALERASSYQLTAAKRAGEAAVQAAKAAAMAAKAALREAELQLHIAALKTAGDEQREEVQAAHGGFLESQATARRKRQEADKLRAAAEREHPRPAPGTAAARQYAAVEAAGAQEPELKREWRQLEQRAATMSLGNAAVAAQYQKAADDADAAVDEAAKASREVETLTAEMDDIEDVWLPELRRVVETINVNFSASFARIGCAGEVALVEGARGGHGGANGGGLGGGSVGIGGGVSGADGGGDGSDGSGGAPRAPAPAPSAARARDYGAWRAEVRVQFRASEPLSVLTAFRQSGGERSVSTILYLVALQGVAETPFRVVDEINQGMDPVNERKVFRLLVEASTKPRTPQCFLLTPKLLPGLPFGPDVTVLSIFNGLHVAPEAAAGLTRERLYGARYDAAVGRRAKQRAAGEREARRAELMDEGRRRGRREDGGGGAEEEDDDDDDGAARPAGGGGGRRAAAGGGGRGDRGLLDV